MTALSCLRREFAGYYVKERCTSAPSNPTRIFNLAFRTLYRHYLTRISPWQFMSVIYDTLGVRVGEPRGLFQTFDPEKYRGRLSLEDHFANLFKKKLWGKLLRSISPKTDNGKMADRAKFIHKPALGLVINNEAVTRSHEDVAEALTCLEGPELMVIYMTYWMDASARQIGVALGLDHKTVRAKHERAICKLRRYYKAEPKPKADAA